MIEDAELLRRYAEEKSEDAFAELVRRRIGLVYAVALRRTSGNAQGAADATQQVFVDLANKAHSLSRRPVIVGWLYRSAQFAAADVLRTERRRQAREQEAHHMQEIENQATEPPWDDLRPVIDELMNEMNERDRDVVLLRFFDGRPFAEIATHLRLTENAARMRVERALEKLRAALARRGVTSTTAALGLALGSQAIAATPAGLIATATGAALAGGTSAAAIGLGAFMGMTKLQVGVVAVVGLTGAIGLVSQGQANADLRRELAAVQAELSMSAPLRAENRQLSVMAAEAEVLRRDDQELQRLAQRVAEAQKRAAERQATDARSARELAQQAQVQAAQDREAQIVAYMQERDRQMTDEVDRMNALGKILAREYQVLAEQVNAPSLTPEARLRSRKYCGQSTPHFRRSNARCRPTSRPVAKI